MTAKAHEDESPVTGHTPLDVIVDTDIGTDVDDAYAVLLAVSSPELNVRAVTVVHGDVDLRAKLAAKLLKLAGREDVPVIVGERHPINSERPIFWLGHEGRGIDFSDVEPVMASQDTVGAAEFIARSAAEKPGEVLLITVGPLTNVGAAIRDFPHEMARLSGIVCMGSTLNGFGVANAGVEHNVATDPEAAEFMLNAGIPVLVVGLNVSMQTSLTRAHVAEIAAAGTPLADLMVRMTEEWLAVANRDGTPMHDPLAVAASFEPAVVTSVPVNAEVQGETAGSVAYFEAGPESPVSICTSVDVGRFDELFHSRISRAVAGGRGCR